MKENRDKNNFEPKNHAVYKCLECGLLYKEKKWRDQCYDWCREHKSCNIEIIEHAIKPNT